MLSPRENSRVQGLFKAFKWFSSTFQGRFHFQGLFKKALLIQELFKPEQTLKLWVKSLLISYACLNIFVGCWKELCHWDNSFEHPEHMFWWRIKTIILYLSLLMLGPRKICLHKEKILNSFLMTSYLNKSAFTPCVTQLSMNVYTVLTTSTEIILGTRKCGPCQERVLIYFKLQEAIVAVKPFNLWKKNHSRIITE